MQALSYAYHIDRDQEYFAKFISKKLGDISDDEMDFDNIRIVLVAPGFESHVEEAVQLVDPQVKLVKYSIYRTAESDALSTSTVFDSISTRPPITPRSDYTLDYHFSGRYAAMKTTFEQLSSAVKSKLNVDPYYRKYFIAFKRNYIFLIVNVYIDRLELGLTLPSDAEVSARFQKPREGRFGPRVTHYIKISNPRDVDEDLANAIAIAYKYS